MFRFLIIVTLSLVLSPPASSASVCDDWNILEKDIRDNLIERNDAREKVIRLGKSLKEEYKEIIGGNEHYFPVEGYCGKCIGGSNGSGYHPAGYNFYDGNRHGGHPAHDLFIRDRRRCGLDDATGKPAEVIAFTDGVVVSVNPAWSYPSRIRGGVYIWIFNPGDNRYYYYAHLQKSLVVPGDRVKGGDTIALLGRTGRNAWPKRSPTHLHFMCLSFDEGRMTPVNTYLELLTAKVK